MTGLVRVWIISAGLSPAATARCRSVLDHSELARLAAFPGPRDQQRFAIAHGALRMLVGCELRMQPAALTWALGRWGKPELAAPWSGLHTSLSHSGDLIAVAISRGRPVGVDIQHLVPAGDTAGLAARFFPPDEASYIAAAGSAGARADRFTRLWARKEAVVKAAGVCAWRNLGTAVHGREVVACGGSASLLRVADVTAPQGFRAAVALIGTAPFAVETAGWPPPGTVPSMAT